MSEEQTLHRCTESTKISKEEWIYSYFFRYWNSNCNFEASEYEENVDDNYTYTKKLGAVF
jgi:hypothetical protein